MATPVTTVFQFPGNITGYTYAEDGSETAASIVAVGGGTGTSQLVYFFLNDSTGSPDGIQIPSLPALEHAVSYQQVTDPAILSQLGQADAKLRAAPIATLTFTVRGDQDPVPGTYSVGDHARVIINDFRFPASLYPGGYDDSTWRITNLTYTPATSGGQDEAVGVVLGKFADYFTAA